MLGANFIQKQNWLIDGIFLKYKSIKLLRIAQKILEAWTQKRVIVFAIWIWYDFHFFIYILLSIILLFISDIMFVAVSHADKEG